jgi:hypothetical protein
VIVFTSYEVDGYFLHSPVMLWFDERPIVNDGDLIKVSTLYYGQWEHQGRVVPTFKVKWIIEN